MLRRNIPAEEADFDYDLAGIASSGLKSKAKNDLYRFCDVERYDDEMDQVMFDFNRIVPDELSASFPSDFSKLILRVNEQD